MTPTKEQLSEALENLRTELSLYDLNSNILEHEFNLEVDATIKKAKRTKRKPSIELASWKKLNEYNQELRADLLEAIRLGSERGIEMPACRKLAVALEGGFDMPKPIQFVFDAMVEIDRLIEQFAIEGPVEDPELFVKQTKAKFKKICKGKSHAEAGKAMAAELKEQWELYKSGVPGRPITKSCAAYFAKLSAQNRQNMK